MVRHNYYNSPPPYTASRGEYANYYRCLNSVQVNFQLSVAHVVNVDTVSLVT